MLNEMNIRSGFLTVLLIMPLLISCSHEKVVSKTTKIMNPTVVIQDQKLIPQEVENVKRTRLLKSRDGQREIYFSASSYQDLKTTPQNKQIILKDTTISPVRSIFISNSPAKDTLVSKKPDTLVFEKPEVIKVDTIVSPKYSPDLAANYVRKVSILKKYNVVVGSFSTIENAYLSVKELNKKDYKALIVQNEDGMYRVITGTFSNRDNAEIHRLALNLDYVSSWVWTKN